MSKDSKDKATGLAHFGTDVHGREGVSAVALPRAHGISDELVRRMAGISVLKTFQVIVLLGGLAFLLYFSLHLAATRMYHAEECANIFSARLLVAGQAVPSVDLFQLLLSKLIPGVTRSVDLFVTARLTMLVIFWSNWLLLATATGERLLSRGWLVALVGAATIAPFWSWGFEVRRENLVITGLLLAWTVVRFNPPKPQSYFVIGTIAGLLQFLAPDAAFYTIPLSLAILVFPPSGATAIRWRLALALVMGVAWTLIAGRILFGMTGLWDSYKSGLSLRQVGSNFEYSFGPGKFLEQLVMGSPLFAALLGGALGAEGMNCFRRGARALNWDGNLPEALLFTGGLGIVFLEGNHPSKDIMYLFPFAFLLAFRYASRLPGQVPGIWVWVPTFATIAIFVHLIPFGIDARRSLSSMNFDQESMMTLVEDLTDPVTDPVFDAMGMVPTRQTVNSRFLPGSVNVSKFDKHANYSVRQVLALQPAAVMILDRHTEASIDAGDRAFLSERYVPLADDLWVLGKVLAPGGDDFDIVHTGRYRVASLPGSDIAGTFPTGFEGLQAPEIKGTVDGKLDGQPLSAGVVELSVGRHRIETSARCQPTVVWVGPRIDRIHRLQQSNRQQAVVDWH